jgi:hypothetical protein
VRDYWQSTGGLTIYGYPISEAFMEVSKSDGKSYLVQYFERNRLEYHPENAGTQFEVQLGLLGSELLDKQGGPQAIEALGQPKYYPAGSGGIRVPPGGLVGTPGATPSGGTTVPAAPALPATRRPVLFSDDFTVGSMVGWSPEVPPDQSDEAPAMWRVRNGILEQYPNAAMEATALEALLVTSPGDYPDATLEAFVYPAGEFVGAVIRHSAAGYYLLQLSGPSAGSEAKARLILVTPQGPQTIKTSSTYAGFKPVTWQKITLTAKGSTITAAVDDVQLFSAQDTVLTHGAAGLYAHADGVAKFDNVRVTAP